MTGSLRRAAAGLVLGAATVNGTSLAASAQGPIRIGDINSYSGTGAAFTAPYRVAVEMALDEVNQKGGVLGRKLELIVEDNKSNPTEAVATAEKLIQKDKVPVLMGAWSSTLTLAVMPKLAEYELSLIHI